MRNFRHLVLFLAAVLAVASPAPAQAEKRVALVIGNNLYPNLPADRQLQRAVNDATTIGTALKTLGFEVLQGTNLGRQGMIDKLAELTAKLEPGDVAAFFYAGHGVAIGGVNYLVPSDVPAVSEGAEVRVRGASLAEPDVVAELQAKSVRVALLVIDACRDNPFPRAAGRSIGNTRGMTEPQPVRGIFTLYSAGINQTALDRLGKGDNATNSVFTRVFAEQLMRPELHLGDVAFETRERVFALANTATDDAGQPAPHEQTPAFYDQTIGGRIFLAGNRPTQLPQVALTAPPPPAPAPVPLPKTTPTPTALDRGPSVPRPSASGESCARNGAENFCVSSTLPPQLGNNYGPANLFGRAADTAWVEGRPGQGVGEWIVVQYPEWRLVRSITLQNGYQKNDDIFDKNSRVRRLRVVSSQGTLQTFTLADRFGPQTLTFDKPAVVEWLQLVIEDVYPGSRYTDTAISKLAVNSERAP